MFPVFSALLFRVGYMRGGFSKRGQGRSSGSFSSGISLRIQY